MSISKAEICPVSLFRSATFSSYESIPGGGVPSTAVRRALNASKISCAASTATNAASKYSKATITVSKIIKSPVSEVDVLSDDNASNQTSPTRRNSLDPAANSPQPYSTCKSDSSPTITPRGLMTDFKVDQSSANAPENKLDISAG